MSYLVEPCKMVGLQFEINTTSRTKLTQKAVNTSEYGKSRFPLPKGWMHHIHTFWTDMSQQTARVDSM